MLLEPLVRARHSVSMYARDTASIATPIGTVTVLGTADWITAVTIGPVDAAPSASDSPAVDEALRQLAAYFDGTLTHFDLPLAACPTARGGTLREAIVAIGYGETATYGTLARAIGSSPRAIGQACARNPFPILVPCHRVLGAGGVLGAYSAGEGPHTKSRLLDLERHQGVLL